MGHKPTHYFREPVSCDGDTVTMEDNFYSYFYELNTVISTNLHRLSMSERLHITGADVRNMGLHSSDINFLSELTDSLNMDVLYTCPNCPCCLPFSFI